MEKIAIKEVTTSVKNLIKRTPDNDTSQNRRFYCQKYDGRVFVAAKQVNGRPADWIEIIL